MPFVAPPDDTTQHSTVEQLKQVFELPTGMMFIINFRTYTYE
jgi:hypothetical protein